MIYKAREQKNQRNKVMSCSILEKLKAQEFVLHVVWLPHMKNTRIIVKDHVLAIVIETKEIFHEAGPKGKFLWNCKQRRLRKKNPMDSNHTNQKRAL
jgi:hypothetical protein